MHTVCTVQLYLFLRFLHLLFHLFLQSSSLALCLEGHHIVIIGGSVDTLCRDETSQISRDPHTKSQRKRLTKPFKHTSIFVPQRSWVVGTCSMPV